MKLWILAVTFLLLGIAQPSAGQQADAPADVVSAFHQAMEDGDSIAALELLDPEVVIFEGGGVEASRDEYRSHHLPADIAFARATEREVTQSWSEIEGDLAVMMAQTKTTGTFREREINSRGVETMVLVRRDEGWRIVHVHWSSRRSRPPGQ